MWTKVKKFLKKHKTVILTSIGVVTLGYLGYRYLRKELEVKQEVKLSAFMQALKEGYVEEVVIEGKNILFRSAKYEWFTTFYGTFPIQQINRLIQQQKIISTFKQGIDKKTFVSIAGIIISLFALYYLKNQVLGDPISELQFQPKLYQNQCSFNDFYGGDLVKTKFKEIIQFLHNPYKFQQFGARIRRGVLLYGPPGTGKTLLARALANEAKCEFIKAAASQFQEMFVGMGAKRVRKLFGQAKKYSNGCIIFIDQIDALGSRINSLRDSHQTTSTITQFLSQMDGFKPLDKVIVVASTNRIDLVDGAVLRSGRFDIKIQVSLPGREERIGIFKTLVDKKLKQHSITEEQIQDISGNLEGCSGADIEAILNESVYKAIREQKNSIEATHLEESAQQFLSKRI